MEEDDVSAMVQDLLELRQSIDARLSASLKRLKRVGGKDADADVANDASSGMTTPTIAAPRKRAREENSDISISPCLDGFPCRTDLSVFGRLIRHGYTAHYVMEE